MTSQIHNNDPILERARDQLFSQVLHGLKGLDAFSRPADPSLFIVYAHDNATAEYVAHASSVKRLIEWLIAINAKILSDKSPLPSWGIDEPEGGDQAAHNIVSNQLRLLPHRSQHKSDIESVGKVIVCGSPLLEAYYHHDFTATYLNKVEAAYADGDTDQAQIRQLVQSQCHSTGFHHALTELAFLRLRYRKNTAQHGIIPIALGVEDIEYLPLQHADLRLIFNPEEDSLHHLFFKLLHRIYPDESQLINAFRACFQNGCKTLQEENQLSEEKVASIIDTELSKTHTSYRHQMQATLRSSRQSVPAPFQSTAEQTAINQCLSDLRITDPRHDKTRIQETKGGLLEDSYIWVLKNKSFHQWREDADRRLLWVRGDPGKGKTMLLCGIIDQLGASPAENGLLSYFFCQGTDNSLNTATAVLRGLIYQLCSQDNSLVAHVKKEYDTAGKALFDDANAWQALSEILRNILQSTSSRQLILIVDALDECLEGPSELLTKLLNLIVETSQSTHVKWLVSSRNELHIEYKLRDAAQGLSLELNSKSISAAVDIYIEHKMSQISRERRYSEKTSREVREYLIAKADGTFLWVALVCQELASKSLSFNAVQKVKSFPSDLNALYERMMTQIRESDDGELCIEVLALITTNYRPLSFAESMTLIDAGGDNVEDDESLQEIVKLCASFLTVRHNTIYFVHQSAKDFLVKKQSTVLFPSGEQAVHKQIFSKSVEAMFRVLKRDMCHLSHPGFAVEDISLQALDVIAPIKYASIYWIDHLLDSGPGPHQNACIQTDGFAHSFLKKKSLYWIESLSIFGSISEGITALQKLIQHLQDLNWTSGFLELVSDTHRLLRTFRPAIETRPLQVYVTALVFTPTESLLRELFSHEGPQWVTCKTEMATTWSECEATLEGHIYAVKSVAFSPDGNYIASGSDDRTINLWHVRTGICHLTLKGHTDSIVSVAFSPTNEGLLISASYDKTAKLWDLQTGFCAITFEGHTERVSSVAFSPDGQYVASCSEDNTIKLWNAKTGTCHATIEWESFWSQSVAFSPDGRHILSASFDNAVKLWNIQTGACDATLQGHTNTVHFAAFSRDGKRIASASEDSTIRLWNAVSYQCEAVFEDRDHGVWSVNLSPDGRRLVSTSGDCTVKIWDADAGVCVGTLVGHTGEVNSVAFSPDGQRIVSASGDNTVRLWTTNLSSERTVSDDDAPYIRSLAFSTDSQCAISSSNENTVKIWDTQTGLCKAELCGRADNVHKAIFSPDGCLIAMSPPTYESSGVIDIWDSQTYNPELTLRFENFRPTYSDADNFLVSIWEGIIRVWNAQTGAFVATFPNHGQGITSIAMSPDGRHITIVSGNYTVEVRKSQTGDYDVTLTGDNPRSKSTAVSPAERPIASAATDFDCEIVCWNLETAQFTTMLQLRVEGACLDSTGTLICENGRSICIDNPILTVLGMMSNVTDPDERQDYTIGPNDDWILKQSRPVLWIPPEYRSHLNKIAALDGGMVLGLVKLSCFIHFFHLSSTPDWP